jgi:hypothetical protein
VNSCLDCRNHSLDFEDIVCEKYKMILTSEYLANYCEYYELFSKEKQMEELKVTKEKVLKASENCPQAKEVLKELFPEAFEPIYRDFDIFDYTGDIRIYYKDNFYNLVGEHCSIHGSGFAETKYKYIGNLKDDSVLRKIGDMIRKNFSKIRN